MSQPYPILQFDEDKSALLEPSRIIARHPEMPQSCVICFFHEVIDHLRETGRAVEITTLRSEMGKHPVYVLKDYPAPIALFHPGIGAPFAAAGFEEVIALGSRKFIACGGAGTLESGHAVGKLLVPYSAVRDEGTSYHYLPPGEEAKPTPLALKAIQETLLVREIPFNLIKTWTTDAIYRETRQKINLRKKDGCECVEMEVAALFAVAAFRGVEFAQILYAGDDLSGPHWDSRGWNDRREIRECILDLAIHACLRI